MMNKAVKRWYIALIILSLISLSLVISDYISGDSITLDDALTLISFIAVLILPYVNNYSVKKRVENLKKELNVESELTLDELLQIRLEREYQKKKALNLQTDK